MKTGAGRLSCGEARFWLASPDFYSCRSWLVSADPHLEAAANGKRQRWVTDGADVLIVHQILALREHRQAIADGVGAAYIDFGVAEVEIAVGQQQRIAETLSLHDALRI